MICYNLVSEGTKWRILKNLSTCTRLCTTSLTSIWVMQFGAVYEATSYEKQKNAEQFLARNVLPRLCG